MNIPPKSDVLISRIYVKGSERQALFVRELSGGDIDGAMFRFDVWKNNIEDERLREESGNIHYIRRYFFNKLFDLADDGWKKMNAGVYGSPNAEFFNPEML